MIKDKVIVITGISSGIGKALHNILKDNNIVYGLSRNPEKAGLRGERYYSIDITDYDAFQNIIKEIGDKEGKIDILILNAGMGIDLTVQEFNASKIDYGIKVNFVSHIYALEAVLPYMMDKKEGMIVSVSSIADCRGLPNSPAYSASKAALTTFMEGMELNLRKKGIDVLIVRPGFIETPLVENSKNPMPFIMSPDKAAKKIIKGIERKKRRIEFPFLMVFITNLAHCVPSWLYRLGVKLWYR